MVDLARQPWNDDEGASRASTLFRRTYGTDPRAVWASPGRVNVVGEHTDYNGGLALPIALPHRTFVAVSPREDGRARLVSDLGDAPWQGEVTGLTPGAVSGWVAYAGGPAWALREDGTTVPGFDLAIVSCVPLGAGLSSSAALGCAVGLALSDLAGRTVDADEERAHLAEVCVRAENEVAGAPTGGMDQAASLRCHDGHALLLDCRDGSVRHVPLDLPAAGLRLLVVDTRAAHALADGQYGARRATCDAAAAALEVDTLREVTDLRNAEARLEDDVARRRVRHVVTEIQRVRDLVAAAEADDWAAVGAVMNASHASLRDDYEVSCRELDVAVDAATRAGALGARMTGGGFGGSAIALVRAEQVEAVGRAVLDAASAAGLTRPELHLAVPSAAGSRIT